LLYALLILHSIIFPMLLSIIAFIIVLSILILVHEFGHFIAAKRAGVWVEEFGLGLPPRVIGKKIGGTIYSLNYLPFGGFVKLHGENGEGGLKKPTKAFVNKSKGVKLVILLGGVIMNFLLAVVAFGIVYSVSGIPREGKDLKIVDISSGSPAQSAGLLVGDVIKKVGGKDITNSKEFISLMEEKRGQKTTLEIERDNLGNKELKQLSITPRENPPENEGPIGVAISNFQIYFPPIWQRPFYGFYYGFKDALFWGKQVGGGLISLVTGAFKGQVPEDLTGPVGIYALTAEISRAGILALVHFVGVLSVNLAILNILPFPALDGGRLLFVVIEIVIRKKVTPKLEAAIHTVGMAILMVLIFALTIRDVQRLISAGSISGFIESILR